MAFPLLPLAMLGGGLLAGRTLGNRRRNRALSVVDAIQRGTGPGAQLEGPPLPLEMQEARGTSLITPAELAIASQMSPEQSAALLTELALPRSQERFEQREAQRAQARAYQMMLPENRPQQMFLAAQAGDDTFQTLSRRTGLPVEVPMPGTELFREQEDRLSAAGFAMQDANEMRGILETLAAEPDFDTFDLIDIGEGRVSALRALSSNILFALRALNPGTGPIDQQTIDILAGVGVEIGMNEVDSVNAILRQLQRTPQSTLQGISRLQEYFARQGIRLLQETEDYEGLRPSILANLRDQIESFTGVPPAQAGSNSPYRRIIDYAQEQGSDATFRGFVDAAFDRAQQVVQQQSGGLGSTPEVESQPGVFSNMGQTAETLISMAGGEIGLDATQQGVREFAGVMDLFTTLDPSRRAALLDRFGDQIQVQGEGVESGPGSQPPAALLELLRRIQENPSGLAEAARELRALMATQE